MINIIFLIITILICCGTVIYTKIKSPQNIEENSIIKKYSNYFFIIVFSIFSISILYKLSSIPKGLHIDEAGAYYDAICLSKFGTDRYMNKLPVYLINFGGGQSALYAYFAAIIIKILGVHITCFRLPAVILSLIALICFYKMIKENYGSRPALLSSFVYAIIPWNIMKSRWGLDCNLFSSMSIISIYFLQKSIKNRKKYFWLISGIFFGLTLYTYATSYMMVPLFLIIIFIYLLLSQNIKISEILVFGIPLFFLALPLILMIFYNNGFISNVKLPFITIPKLWEFRVSEIAFSNILENIKNIWKNLFIKDAFEYNSIPEFGTLYIMSIPLVICGIGISIKNTVKSVKNKEITLDFIILAFFVSIFVISLFLESLNINKLNAIYILMVYFIGKFLEFISQKIKFLVIGILLCYIISYGMFLNYYFKVFSEENLQYFENEILYATKIAEQHKKGNGTIYVENFVDQIYIYTLDVNQISPSEFNNNFKMNKDNICTSYGNYNFNIYESTRESEDDVYIIKNDLYYIKLLENLGFKKENCGKLFILWKE